MAILRGWGKEIKLLLNQADHTYVTCDGGHAWPCWGGSTDGRELCHGSGSSASADCFAQPGSHAGILYGITGVCHQTANRILYPATVTVSAAKGYMASWLLYNTYGTNNVVALAEWLMRLQKCTGSTGEIPDCQATETQATAPASDELQSKIIDLYSKAMSGGEAADGILFEKEHRLVMTHKLGKAFDSGVSDSVLAMRKDAWTRKEEIDNRLKTHRISGESYAQEINTLGIEIQQEAAKAMGLEAFTSVFEFTAEELVNIVDPQIATAVWGEEI